MKKGECEMAIQNIITELRIRADQLENTNDPAKRDEIIKLIYYFLQLKMDEILAGA